MTALFLAAILALQPVSDRAGCTCEKVIEARITGYYAEPEAKGALGTPVRSGGTAAVSRNCPQLLGEKIYIDQHGVWEVNDLTAEWVGIKFGICTVDLAKPSVAEAQAVGNEIRTVVRISR